MTTSPSDSSNPLRQQQESPTTLLGNPNFHALTEQEQLPQTPKTLTLESPDLRNPVSDPRHLQAQQGPEATAVEEEEEEEEEEGDRDFKEAIAQPKGMPRPSSRTGSKKSRTQGRRKKRRPEKRKIEEKVQTLTGNLKPLRFLPSKSLDFAKHEALLKRLDLWDFVNLEFDREIRADLLVQLLANYNHSMRCSYVNERRINVTRAELARALKLPLRKTGSKAEKAGEGAEMEALSGEFVAFFEDFLSNWVLLHEDTCMMPDDVVEFTKFVKEGHPEKVDWASLIWYMVEKEVMQEESLTRCYYASHIQCLMRSQKKSLFEEDIGSSVQGKKAEQGGGRVHIHIKDDDEEKGLDGESGGDDDDDGEETGEKMDVDIKEKDEEEVGGCELETSATDGKSELATCVETEVEMKTEEDELGCCELRTVMKDGEEELAAGIEVEIDVKENEVGDSELKTVIKVEKKELAGGIEAEVDVKEAEEVGDCELKTVIEDEKEELAVGTEAEVGVKEEDVGDCELKTVIKDEKEELAGGIEVEIDLKEEEVRDCELETVTENEKMELVPSAEQEVEVKENEDGGVGYIDDDMEEQNLDLTLGQDGIEKEERKANANIEIVESKDQEHGRMAFKGSSYGIVQYMRRCSSDKVIVLDSGVGKEVEEVKEDEGIELEDHQQEEAEQQQEGEDLEEEYEQQGEAEQKQEEEEDEMEEDEDEDDGEQGQPGLFNLLPNHHVVDNVSSERLVPVEEQNPYNLAEQLQDHFSEEFVASGSDGQRISVGPSICNNGGKRQIDHDAAMSPRSLHVSYKKLKVGGSWDEYTDFGSYCDQMEQFIRTMRMMHKEKEQVCAQLTVNEQYLLNQVRERDNVIEQLSKVNYDEVQKWKMEIYKRDRELNVMYKLVQDYQKALRETNRTFSEYRKLCPKHGEEPLYMDVVGGGGLVLSKAEVEKLRLRKEAEEAAKRVAIEKQIAEFEEAWCKKFKADFDAVNILESKIAACIGDVGVLKRRFQNGKASHDSGPPLVASTALE